MKSTLISGHNNSKINYLPAEQPQMLMCLIKENQMAKQSDEWLAHPQQILKMSFNCQMYHKYNQLNILGSLGWGS